MALPFLLSALCLQWQGCIIDGYPAGGPQPERLSRDSGDVLPSGSFRKAEKPLDLKSLRLSQPVEFWEQRFDDSRGGLVVANASKENCASVTVPCPGPLSEFRSDKGEPSGSVFNQGQYMYFVGWNGSRTLVWNDRNATLSFLGRLDGETDALFWAEHQGYWGDSTYIREIPGGFEILTERIESLCPFRQVRVRIVMRPDGHSEETARVTVVESDHCVVQ